MDCSKIEPYICSYISAHSSSYCSSGIGSKALVRDVVLCLHSKYLWNAFWPGLQNPKQKLQSS